MVLVVLLAGVLDGSWGFSVCGGSGAVGGMVGDGGVGVAGWQPVVCGVDGACVADGLIVSLPGRCDSVD